jgi:hydroxyethylthiazole kinase-like sugar kinase family protein
MRTAADGTTAGMSRQDSAGAAWPAGSTSGEETGNAVSANTGATSRAVPVFNSKGNQIGAAVVNPATGAVDLVGPGGRLLGAVEQHSGMSQLVGAGGALLGRLGVHMGQVVFIAAG